MLSAALLAGAASLSATAPAPACRALADPAREISAHWREAAGAIPAVCEIDAILRPVRGSRIGYTLWLPEPWRWNGRFQMVGNGGYAAALPVAAMHVALARGSAVAATDTGHRGDDPDFALGRPETIIDWGWRSVHVTAVAAKAIVARYYRKAAAHSYFAGCSTGGHQAMSEAQRFPGDFDGIVAGAPGNNRVRLNAAFLWQFLANHRRGGGAETVLQAADLRLLADLGQATCGRANGSAAGGLAGDRWLNDPMACRVDPAALICRPGQTAGCLTSDKVAAARRLYAGAIDPRTGKRATFPWLPGSEPGWSAYWADPARPDQPARANFWRIWAGKGSDWDWWRFGFGRDLDVARRRLSAHVDAMNPSLAAFHARGGKLIQYHGLADPVVSPLDSLAYRRTMIATTDPRGHAGWYRLFLVPGMGHCGGGEGFTRFDAQTAIEDWVERGRAPDRLVATTDDGASRPLCPYPRRTVFRSGDPIRAGSFACRPHL